MAGKDTKDENLATASNSAGVTVDPGAGEAPAKSAAFNGATASAFDHDGDGEPGGSVPRKVGAVLKRGKPALADADLGTNPAALVVVRITERGDGRVHDGTARGRYDHGDEVVLPLSAALALRGDPSDKKARNYVEIIGKV